ncbi:hypothetical protein LZ31DRAFT_49726 [Colletotrichum somersetense]|nr:hypothetical protein LZ31DRAFT_49726 [Colletotrichum somersetense]
MYWFGMTVNLFSSFPPISHEGRFWRASVWVTQALYFHIGIATTHPRLLFRAIMPCSWKLHNGPATTAAISLNKVILRSPTQLHKFKSSAEYPEAGWLDGSGPKEAGYTLLVFLGAVPRMAGKVVCACRRLERPLAATLRIANDQKTSCQGVPAVALGTPVVLGLKMQTTVPCRWTWQTVGRQAYLCAPPTRHGIPSSVLPIYGSYCLT